MVINKSFPHLKRKGDKMRNPIGMRLLNKRANNAMNHLSIAYDKANEIFEKENSLMNALSRTHSRGILTKEYVKKKRKTNSSKNGILAANKNHHGCRMVGCQHTKQNYKKMERNVTRLTWLEEWLFYFSYLYGRLHTRWKDWSKTWKMSIPTLQKVLKAKLKMVKEARDRWPKFASLEEDEDLRKDHWNEMIDGDKRVRLIMHDMSNIPLPQPSEPEFNRATYSKYYGGNCAKGGIFTQLCGWEGTLELFTGSIGDSEYITKSNILGEQQSFADNDQSRDGSMVPFTNTFDKGYRVLLECYEHGKQLCWQPVFARSDERYGSYGTLLTATVAYTRSGNERSVRHMKHSWLVTRGPSSVGEHYDLNILADIWLTFGFQVIFMYHPVH